MGWIVFVHQAATLSAQCTLCSDPDNLDTIILMNRESDLPGCGGGRVLSAAARKSLCQHKTQSTFSSQFLSPSGPSQAGKKVSRDMSQMSHVLSDSQDPRKGWSHQLQVSRDRLHWHGDTERGQAPVLTRNWSRRPPVHSCTFNPLIKSSILINLSNIKI